MGDKTEYFDTILGFGNSHSKEEKIQQIATKYDLNLNQIIYITDTTADILELILPLGILPKNNLFGVNWGYQGNQKLGELLQKSQLIWNFEEFKNLI